MTNDQMKPGRYARWAFARRLHRRIVAHIDAGGVVDIGTSGRVTRITSRHRDMIRAGKDGLYIQAGRRWDCLPVIVLPDRAALSGCGIRFH
jgi:hypothetical protein